MFCTDHHDNGLCYTIPSCPQPWGGVCTDPPSLAELRCLRSGTAGLHKQTPHTAQAGNPTESQRPEQDCTDLCRIHPLRGGKKRSSCSMLHLRKAFPSSQHSLEPQHTFVWPAVCAGWLPARLSPKAAASTGTPRAALLGHQGLGLSGDGRKSPVVGKGTGCCLTGTGPSQRNLRQYGTNRWRTKSRCSL